MSAEHDSTGSDALVRAAVAGDREALSRLWTANRRWVAAVLLSHRPAGADLEDLLQEVAMRLVSKIGTVREEANIRAWLRAVAVNVARSAARSRRTGGAGPVGDLADLPHPVPSSDDGAGEILDRVGRLPDHYREPLLLRAVHGMRTRQIAEILELEPATVDTRIARARRMLREPGRLRDEPTAAEAPSRQEAAS